jgi:hypothetical protein
MRLKRLDNYFQALKGIGEALASFFFYKVIVLLLLGLTLLAGTVTYAILYGQYPDCSPDELADEPWTLAIPFHLYRPANYQTLPFVCDCYRLISLDPSEICFQRLQ